MQENPDYYDNKQSINDDFQYNRLHFFDYFLGFISLIIISVAIINGVINQNQNNEITKKDNDINQIMLALDKYYIDSNNVPSEQKYPLALCNGKPNEVDFEYTLKNSLAGKIKTTNTFEYIKQDDFPIDTSGDYSTKSNDKKVKLRECPKVFANKKTNPEYIYADQSPSCNFDRENKDLKYQSCYLYSTDNLGFEYKIGYYDQYKKAYIIYSKNRGEAPRKSLSGG